VSSCGKRDDLLARFPIRFGVDSPPIPGIPIPGASAKIIPRLPVGRAGRTEAQLSYIVNLISGGFCVIGAQRSASRSPGAPVVFSRTSTFIILAHFIITEAFIIP